MGRSGVQALSRWTHHRRPQMTGGSRQLVLRCRSPTPRLNCSSRPEAEPVKDLPSIGPARRPEVRALLAVVAAALAVLLVVVAVVQVRNFVQGIEQSVSGKTIDRS